MLPPPPPRVRPGGLRLLGPVSAGDHRPLAGAGGEGGGLLCGTERPAAPGQGPLLSADLADRNKAEARRLYTPKKSVAGIKAQSSKHISKAQCV
jgi:hypothetical protein